MYIKEVTLEGFKSCATRTVVPGFDQFFNAITGLNGSGKSNILDSICFVLGITNLQQVRAANLQELAYKQGQAGITKATVSIVFDNSDWARSPLGYEAHSELTVTRQIVVGGRNKYLINGKLAQPSQIASNIEDMKQSLKERDCAIRNAEEGAADLKKRAEELSHSLNEYETQYQGVIAGKSSGNEEKCLEDQLGDAKRAVGSAETELEQLKTKIRHCEKELKEKNSQLMSKREEAVAVESELKARKTDVENVKVALESLPYKEGQMEALQKDRSSELECVQKLKDELRNLSGHLGNVDFSYRDPVNNLDRSKVKGVFAKLIKVKDSSTMTALEVTAGGQLFNVVVDTESTGKQLLQNGNLRKRVTIIPLNKIQAHMVPPRVQNAAAKLVGKENAELALSLVGYDEQLRSAMEYVFGSTFVCKTTDAAKEVAFNREVRTPSVTLEGDIFQPSGLFDWWKPQGWG